MTEKKTGGLALIKKSTSLASAVTKSSSTTTVQASDTESLVICLDCSGSMRDRVEDGTKMSAATSAAASLVRASGVMSRIGAIAFHDHVAESIDGTTSRGALIERMSAFDKHEGGTQFAPAIRQALNMIAASKWGAIKRIIFLSDGEDLGPFEDLAAVVADGCAAKVIIDTVMFGNNEVGEATLKKMSEKTGGIFCLAKDAASLRRTFMSLEAGARGLLGKGKP